MGFHSEDASTAGLDAVVVQHAMPSVFSLSAPQSFMAWQHSDSAFTEGVSGRSQKKIGAISVRSDRQAIEQRPMRRILYQEWSLTSESLPEDFFRIEDRKKEEIEVARLRAIALVAAGLYYRQYRLPPGFVVDFRC